MTTKHRLLHLAPDHILMADYLPTSTSAMNLVAVKRDYHLVPVLTEVELPMTAAAAAILA